MRNWILQKIQWINTAVILAVVILACAGVVNAQDEQQADKWRFEITPYVWLPQINGSMKLEAAPGFGSGSIDISPSSYLEYLNFTTNADFRMHKGKYSILADFVYVDFSGSQSAHYPGVLPPSEGWSTAAAWDLQGWYIQPAGAFTVFRNKHLNFDLMAGIRYSSLDSRVALDITGPLPDWVLSPVFAETKGFIDPMVGFRGRFELGRNWYLPYSFDIGGFGADSDLILGSRLGIGYRFVDWFSLGLDYRYLYHDYGDKTKLMKDVNLYGLAIHIGFNF